MRIQTVKTSSDFNKFIKFPWSIYKDDENWVPPLLFDIKFVLNKSPFWEHAQKELFLAIDDDEQVIGRIAGIVDRHYIEFQGENVGFFGFFECINNRETAELLFNTVKHWLKSKNIDKMYGPMNPSTNDECGFLCEGFDSSPVLMMPYNPDYYLELAQDCGLKKKKELYAYDINVEEAPMDRLAKLARIIYKKNPGLSIRPMNLKDFKNEIEKTIEVYNQAWEKNWGFVPWTKKEFHTMASRMKDLINPKFAVLAEINGKPIGIKLSIPDYNIITKELNGRLFPFGFLKILLGKNKIKSTRTMIVGVIKDYRNKGIEGLMYYEAFKNAKAYGLKRGEFSWILDDNILTQRSCESMGGVLYKKYRVYEN
ncbi:hypothetical protein ACFL58_02645 [Elusimicrobiota bacterium]